MTEKAPFPFETNPADSITQEHDFQREMYVCVRWIKREKESILKLVPPLGAVDRHAQQDGPTADWRW